jgi:hypothetical protein
MGLSIDSTFCCPRCDSNHAICKPRSVMVDLFPCLVSVLLLYENLPLRLLKSRSNDTSAADKNMTSSAHAKLPEAYCRALEGSDDLGFECSFLQSIWT